MVSWLAGSLMADEDCVNDGKMVHMAKMKWLMNLYFLRGVH